MGQMKMDFRNFEWHFKRLLTKLVKQEVIYKLDDYLVFRQKALDFIKSEFPKNKDVPESILIQAYKAKIEREN